MLMSDSVVKNDTISDGGRGLTNCKQAVLMLVSQIVYSTPYVLVLCWGCRSEEHGKLHVDYDKMTGILDGYIDWSRSKHTEG